MAFPLVAALIAAGATAGAASNLYSQYKQRELYQYQRAGYERMLADWQKRHPNRKIRYPELSFPGHIRALNTGISQSYASSVGSVAGLVGNYAGGYAYTHRSGGSLYGGHTGRSSRYL